MLDLAHATPWLADPCGYPARHRNDTPQALADCIVADHALLVGRRHPASHYPARHCAYIPRAAA